MRDLSILCHTKEQRKEWVHMGAATCCPKALTHNDRETGQVTKGQSAAKESGIVVQTESGYCHGWSLLSAKDGRIRLVLDVSPANTGMRS